MQRVAHSRTERERSKDLTEVGAEKDLKDLTEVQKDLAEVGARRPVKRGCGGETPSRSGVGTGVVSRWLRPRRTA